MKNISTSLRTLYSGTRTYDVSQKTQRSGSIRSGSIVVSQIKARPDTQCETNKAPSPFASTSLASASQTNLAQSAYLSDHHDLPLTPDASTSSENQKPTNKLFMALASYGQSIARYQSTKDGVPLSSQMQSTKTEKADLSQKISLNLFRDEFSSLNEESSTDTETKTEAKKLSSQSYSSLDLELPIKLDDELNALHIETDTDTLETKKKASINLGADFKNLVIDDSDHIYESIDGMNTISLNEENLYENTADTDLNNPYALHIYKSIDGMNTMSLNEENLYENTADTDLNNPYALHIYKSIDGMNTMSLNEENLYENTADTDLNNPYALHIYEGIDGMNTMSLNEENLYENTADTDPNDPYASHIYESIDDMNTDSASWKKLIGTFTDNNGKEWGAYEEDGRVKRSASGKITIELEQGVTKEVTPLKESEPELQAGAEENTKTQDPATEKEAETSPLKTKPNSLLDDTKNPPKALKKTPRASEKPLQFEKQKKSVDEALSSALKKRRAAISDDSDSED